MPGWRLRWERKESSLKSDASSSEYKFWLCDRMDDHSTNSQHPCYQSELQLNAWKRKPDSHHLTKRNLVFPTIMSPEVDRLGGYDGTKRSQLLPSMTRFNSALTNRRGRLQSTKLSKECHWEPTSPAEFFWCFRKNMQPHFGIKERREKGSWGEKRRRGER